MEMSKVPNLAFLSNEEVCQEIGARLRAERLRRSLSQAEMSHIAGISLRTYKRLEADGSGSIATLVAALRACERLIGFHLLLPQPTLAERKNPLADIVKRRAPKKKLVSKLNAQPGEAAASLTQLENA